MLEIKNQGTQKAETWHTYLGKPDGMHLWSILVSHPFCLWTTSKKFTYKQCFCAERKMIMIMSTQPWEQNVFTLHIFNF
jgi:hypothetical protein